MKKLKIMLLMAVITLGVASMAAARTHCCSSAECCASCSGCK
jgi:hypothetical protein